MSPALTAPSHIRTVTTFDNGWYRSVTSFAQQTAWLHEPMHLYTAGGIVLLALLAVCAWWTARARADRTSIAAVAWLGLGPIVSVGAGLMLKKVFEESRPCQALHVVTVEACPGSTDYSFPSDHTTFAVALALGVWLVNRKLGVIALALAALEGFDRVYTGQHYPHDVVAAAILGAVVMLLGWRLARRPLTRLVEVLEQTRLRPLLTAAGEPADARTTATM
jgi:membrane-associated phospholipid phosphatase